MEPTTTCDPWDTCLPVTALIISAGLGCGRMMLNGAGEVVVVAAAAAAGAVGWRKELLMTGGGGWAPNEPESSTSMAMIAFDPHLGAGPAAWGLGWPSGFTGDCGLVFSRRDGTPASLMALLSEIRSELATARVESYALPFLYQVGGACGSTEGSMGAKIPRL